MSREILPFTCLQKNSPLGLIDLEMCLKVSKGNQEGKVYNFEVLTINRNFPLQSDSKVLFFFFFFCYFCRLEPPLSSLLTQMYENRTKWIAGVKLSPRKLTKPGRKLRMGSLRIALYSHQGPQKMMKTGQASAFPKE